jgi:hypothetical protein
VSTSSKTVASFEKPPRMNASAGEIGAPGLLGKKQARQIIEPDQRRIVPVERSGRRVAPTASLRLRRTTSLKRRCVRAVEIAPRKTRAANRALGDGLRKTESTHTVDRLFAPGDWAKVAPEACGRNTWLHKASGA